MKPSAHWSFRLMILLLAASLSLSTVGCKNKKKLAEEQARQEALAVKQKNDAIGVLEHLLSKKASNFAELDQMEADLAAIKAQNIDDAEVQILIKKAELHLQQERERLERERKAAQETVNTAETTQALGPKMNQYFAEIARAGNSAIANAKIEEAVRLFSSGDAPVLIVISQNNGEKDYDRPTTIRKYLNYLKDTGHNFNSVQNVVLDANGKIKELELIKQ